MIPSSFGSFGGVRIVLSDLLPGGREFKQVRFPKSKKKRIRKKWAKNKRRNWRSVESKPVIMEVGGTFYCNRVAYRQLKKGLDEHGKVGGTSFAHSFS